MPIMIGLKTWAVLLCRFSSDSTQHDVAFYKDFYDNLSSTGMADYWLDVSHGRLESRADIYGWEYMPYTLDDYSKLDRCDKILKSAQYFSQLSDVGKQVDFRSYHGIIVVTDKHVTEIGGCGINELELNGSKKQYGMVLMSNVDAPNIIAHEMGHGFGLDHSFDDSARKLETWSAPGEYYDMWDIMSATNVFSFRDRHFGLSGPMLNAPYMESMGWLDSGRIRKLANLQSFETAELAPLSHPERDGFLMARIDYRDYDSAKDCYYTVEFRVNDRLDLAIPRPTVLIHKVKDGVSYLLSSDLPHNIQDWQPGQVFADGRNNVRIEVISISQKATIKIGPQSEDPKCPALREQIISLNNELYALSEDLNTALPGERPGILKEIKRVKGELSQVENKATALRCKD